MFRWAGADRPLVAGNQPFSLCSFQFPPGWFLESFLSQGDLLRSPSPRNCLCNRTDWQSLTLIPASRPAVRLLPTALKHSGKSSPWISSLKVLTPFSPPQVNISAAAFGPLFQSRLNHACPLFGSQAPWCPGFPPPPSSLPLSLL